MKAAISTNGAISERRTNNDSCIELEDINAVGEVADIAMRAVPTTPKQTRCVWFFAWFVSWFFFGRFLSFLADLGGLGAFLLGKPTFVTRIDETV